LSDETQQQVRDAKMAVLIQIINGCPDHIIDAFLFLFQAGMPPKTNTEKVVKMHINRGHESLANYTMSHLILLAETLKAKGLTMEPIKENEQ
jgi:hypothetical protein